LKEAPSNDEQEKYLKKRKNFGNDQISTAAAISTHAAPYTQHNAQLMGKIECFSRLSVLSRELLFTALRCAFSEIKRNHILFSVFFVIRLKETETLFWFGRLFRKLNRGFLFVLWWTARIISDWVGHIKQGLEMERRLTRKCKFVVGLGYLISSQLVVLPEAW
jgi:hypothetical protein